MNYNALRYFSVLAEVENYTNAAARLGISQPSLSSAIRNLEEDLGGIPLFEKVGRNIRLTQEGKFYRMKVDAALAELHSAAVMLKDRQESAPVFIRIGFVSGAIDDNVRGRIAEYARMNERVRFLMTEHSTEALMDLVRREQLDMAIVDYAERDRSLHFRKLRERDLCVALAEDHPLADREYILPKDVLGESQIVINYSAENNISDWTTGKAPIDNVVCTVNTVQGALDMVGTGLGVAFIPAECAQPAEGVRYVPLKNWRQALYMCILYDKWLPPKVWELRQLIIHSFDREND